MPSAATIRGLLLFAFLALLPAASGEELAITFHFSRPVLEPSGSYQRVSLPGLPLRHLASRPLLPYRPVCLLLPPNSRLQGIRCRRVRPEELPEEIVPLPASCPVPLSLPALAAAPRPDPAVYGGSDLEPAALISSPVSQSLCGFPLCCFSLFPVRYRGRARRLLWYPEITVVLDLEPDPTRSGPGMRRSLAVDRRRLKGLVDNPEMLRKYGPGRSAPLRIPWVLVASSSLRAAFEPLVAARSAAWGSATAVETEWIRASYPGRDEQEKIRNFIRDAYLTWGTEFVLLGGDREQIPPRLLYVEGVDNGALSGDWTALTAQLPADLYYANLDGSFNSDGDDRWGEPADGPGGGEIDLFSEVSVGRFPVADFAEATALTAKTLAYEAGATSWKSRAVMVGEYLGFGGSSDYAQPVQEEVRLGSSAHGYLTAGFASRPEYDAATVLYDADFTPIRWAHDPELFDLLDDGVGLINHLGHGSTYSAWRTSVAQAATLANSFPFFGLTQACNCGGFDYPDCWAETMTTVPGGACGLVANARYGFGYPDSTDGPSQRFAREFWDALLAEEIRPAGTMLADARSDLAGRIGEDNMRWCFYELNLLGDPALVFPLVPRPSASPTPAGFHTPVPTPTATPVPSASPTPPRGAAWMEMSDVSDIILSYTASPSQVGWEVIVCRDEGAPLARIYDWNRAFWRDYDGNNGRGPVALHFHRNNTDISYPEPLEVSVTFEAGTALAYVPAFSTSLRNRTFWLGCGSFDDGYYYCPTYSDRWLNELTRGLPSPSPIASPSPDGKPTPTAAPSTAPSPSLPASPTPRPTPPGTFFVDGSGAVADDSFSGAYPAWEGQSDGPWRTLNYAVARLQPGDTCWVRFTNYREKVWSMASSGVPGSEIRLRGDWQGEIWPDSLARPVIDGEGDRGYCIDQYSGDYWTYENLELRDPGQESDDACFRVRDPHHHVSLHNCVLRGGTTALLLNYRTWATRASDCHLLDAGYGVRMKLNTPETVSLRMERCRISGCLRGIAAVSGGYANAELDLGASLICDGDLEGVFGHFSALTARQVSIAGHGRWGIYNLHTASAGTMTGCIVAENGSGIRTRAPGWGGSNNDVWNWGENFGGLARAGPGTFSADPLFLEDYDIADASPCNAAGDPAFAPATDIHGDPYLSPPSLGCDENPAPRISTPIPVPTSSPPPSSSPTAFGGVSPTPAATGSPAPTRVPCAAFFSCTEIENAVLGNPRGSVSYSWYWVFGDGSGTLPGRGWLADRDNCFVSGDSRPGPLSLRLVPGESSSVSVAVGDEIQLAVDGGREVRVRLPALSGDEPVDLYVREDGATCFDAALCLLACGTPSPTPQPTATSSPSPAPTPVHLAVGADDYDGDGTTDPALYCPVDGTWYVEGVTSGLVWGGDPRDVPVPGDYDGDGRAEPAVFRAGTWHIWGFPSEVEWGQGGDLPVPGDYDGDGTTDAAVWRPDEARWYVRGGGPGSIRWGQPGDIPVPGDYDGDGRDDLALWRPASRIWFVWGLFRIRWGAVADVPVPLDHDGDGAADLGIWRPGRARWFIWFPGGAARFAGSAVGELGLTGDFDGDGRDDAANYRPDPSRWTIRFASDGSRIQFGSSVPPAVPVTGHSR